MPEIREPDALRIAREFYNGKKYSPEDIRRVLAILQRVAVLELIIYAYNAGVSDAEAEK